MDYLDLPVYRHKDLILKALESSQVVVVESPTGSGKTTQMPVILHDAGYAQRGIIGVTQPRRIAAVSVSEFIARQMGEPMPGVVGYKMRFEDKTCDSTAIKIMTDGILLQEMKLDPFLSKYAALVVDEAHERSLNIDFILGLLKRILEARREFKVIISSATINTAVFSQYFGECPVVKIDAQTFPVTLVYDAAAPEAPPEGAADKTAAEDVLLDKIDAIVDRFINERREGDILIFLPGEKIIKECMNRLALSRVGRYLHLLPLYGRLGKEEQERVFDKTPRGKTKVVISTNIAETSVTIDGVTAVIDSGRSKLNYYSPRTFTSSLVEGPISRASGNQRKGRAGRTREGTCYRLYSRRDFENRPLFTTEEIYRTDLSEVVLRMADLGITAFEEFDFISPPGREALRGAVETLKLLDALEEDRSLSRTGRLMTAFPLAPRHSRIMVEAIIRYPQVTEETIIAAAFLSTQSPYLLPPGEETDARKAHHSFQDKAGDFVSYLKLYRAYLGARDRSRFCEKSYLDEKAMAEILNVVEQLSSEVSDMGIPVLSGGGIEDYLCCVARGLIQFVCIREGRGMYRSLTADRIFIHPGSVMFHRPGGDRAREQDPQFIVAGEIVRTTRMYAMSVSPLSRDALERISPGLAEDLLLLKGFEAADAKPSDGERERGARKTRRTEGRGDRGDIGKKITIGEETFAVETLKGKPYVRLPWERLRRVLGKSPAGLDAKTQKALRGEILFQGDYPILGGEKLSLIMTLAAGLDLEGALGRTWPKKFSVLEEEGEKGEKGKKELVEALRLVLAPALWKPDKKDLGFLTLFNDGEGTYRLRCSRGFHTALNESLASLEALIDDLGEVDPALKGAVNQAYRRLSDLLS